MGKEIYKDEDEKKKQVFIVFYKELVAYNRK